MKTNKLFFLAAIAMLFANCTNQEIDVPFQTGTAVAVMETEDTKSNVTEQGFFTWKAGDQITIHATGTSLLGTLSAGADSPDGTFTYSYTETPDLTGYAMYPYSLNHKIEGNTITFHMPDTYELGGVVSNTNAPMLAKPSVEKNSNATATYNFSHLGGVIRVVFKKAPVGTDRFTLSLGGSKINGDFEVDLIASVPQIATSVSETGTLTTLKFNALEEEQDITLFVPVPTGNYTGIEAKLYKGEECLGTWGNETATNKIARRALVLMAPITFSNAGGNIENNQNVATATQLEEAVANGGHITLIEDITLDETLTINKPVTLDGNCNTLTSTATRAINVETEGSVTIQNLTIKAAERAINIIDYPATVNVNKVTATANNNAIMIATSAGAANLTVEDSDLTGLAVINVAGAGAQVEIKNTKITNVDPVGTDAAYGAITISGTAENSKVNVDTNSTITVADNSKKAYVFPGTAVIEGVDNVGYVYATIGDNGCETLAKAIEEAEAGQTITILRDITASEIITINKAITLEGNGKTLTSTAGRAINVSGADGVTIQNLTIEASGERAINIIQKATNVTIDNVTATAANYTVNVASSAPSAVVAIKNSTLNGLCTVNVAAASASVTVDNSTVNCNDNNATEGESYAALSLNKDATGGSIVATNSTINVAEGSDSSKGRNGADNGIITIDASEEQVLVDVAAITYEGSDYYHAFSTLAKAVEFAEAGQIITLIRDIEITELIAVNKAITIDLNEKTVTAKCQKAFEIYADATIQNGTIISQQRCVDTREAVNLTLTDLTLNAPTYYAAYGNQQPLTIGGSEDGTKVTMSNVKMDAGYQGYCIISFVKTELTATASNLSGYSALYVKADSENSTFSFAKSTLSGTTGSNDVEGNSFATIAIEANNVKVTMDNDCTLNSTGTYHTKTSIGDGVTGSTITGPATE